METHGACIEKMHLHLKITKNIYKDIIQCTCDIVKARCWKPPGRYLCTPEPGRPDCVISIEICVNGDVYPVAISQKVTKNLPVSFYSPMPGFNRKCQID